MDEVKKVAILSSVYGNYDKLLLTKEQAIPCEFIMVSDQPNVAGPPWKNVTERRPSVPPRLASRVPKCNPWLYTDADIAIWVDGNIEITSPHFAEWCVESLGDDVLCQHKQDRKSIQDEAIASFSLGKWQKDPLDQQVDYYLSKGYPSDYGIWWCGFSIRSRECPNFGDEWMAEMVRWTCQDQLAYSYIMWELGMRPKNLDIPITPLPDIEKRSSFINSEFMIPTAPYLYDKSKGAQTISLFRAITGAQKGEYFSRHLHPDNGR